MSTSFWLDRSQNSKRRSTDVVIVGAGISGLSAAYWLQQEDPSLKITIVEKGRVGYGASGRNAGFVTCGSVEHFNRLIGKHGKKEATEIWRFSEENLNLLQEHIIQNDVKNSQAKNSQAEKLQFEKKGCFSLAAQTTEFQELQKVAEIMNELKIGVEVYDSAQVKKATGAHHFVGGIKYVDDATVNPVSLLTQMQSKLTNVEILEGTEFYGFESTNSGTRIAKTDSGDIETTMIIFALNGYSASLNPYFADKIYPTRAQILMMEKVPRFMEGPCYANFYLDYFRQLPSGELLIGGFRQLEKATEVGYSDHVTDVIQSALHDFVKHHLPQYEGRSVSHRWSGVMGFSKDGQPMVGSLPDDNQVFFLGGYTGHGLGLAFNTAKNLVGLIFGREVPNWLSARRFQ